MLNTPVQLDYQYTVDEFEAWIRLPENRDRRWQLIHGRIIEKMPTQLHGIIVMIIGGEIYVCLLQFPIGWIATEVRHRLPGDEHNARLPDLAFYLKNDDPIIDKGAVPRMPDLAVEVQSPDDSMEDLRERADYFLNNGTQLVWLVFPRTRTVEVCQLRDGRLHIEVFKQHETLDGGAVLPGFTLAIQKIFPTAD
jgi:Uma2 family endonuclease